MEPSTSKQVHKIKGKSISKPNEDSKSTGNKPQILGAGIKTSLHGTTYQLKLLMLFIKRGLDHGYTFKIATEMDAAEKFDDLVFRYENDKKDGYIYRFLQAKHKQDDDKKTSVEDLLKETDDNFSIQKYFISYRKIIQNPEFVEGNVEFKDFIICTNIDFEDKMQSWFKEINSADNILDNVKCPKQSKRLLIGNFPEKQREKLFSMLKSTSDFHRLAKRLALNVANQINAKVLTLAKDELYKKYRGWLLANVFSKKLVDKRCFVTFSYDFFNSQNVEISNFRELFNKAYLEAVKAQTLDKLKTIKFDVPPGFAIDETEANSVFSIDNVSDEEIRTFLDKLIFAVNQPNEVELSAIIQHEIGEHFNLIDSSVIASSFQEYILDWVKEKHVRFLTSKEGKELFQCLKQNLARLGLISSTLINKIKVNTGYNFKEDIEVIQVMKKFLNGSSKEQILTVYEESRLLSTIKIFQVNKNTKIDEDIFNNLTALESLVGSAACPINAFRSEAYNNLIINVDSRFDFDCKQMLKSFFKVVVYNPNKRIILIISKHQHDIAEKTIHLLCNELSINEDEKYISINDDENNLIDLTPESQKILMEEGKLTFNGTDVTLSMLIEENSKNIIRGQTFSKLIFNEKVEVGKASIDENYDDIKDYYIERSFYRLIKITNDIKTSTNDFTVISGDKINELVPPKQDLLLISDFEDEFYKISVQYPFKNIHWVKETRSGLIYQKSQGSISKLRKFVDENQQNECCSRLHSKDLSDKVSIIAAAPGMGKSTVLTHLARQVKEELNMGKRWILKIDLVNHSKEFSVKHRTEFDAKEKKVNKKKRRKGVEKNKKEKDAIKFLYKAMEFDPFKNEKDEEIEDYEIAINELSHDISIKFNKNDKVDQLHLFRVELFNNFYNQGNVVLLLDGFDEISPHYKSQVLDLLEVLKDTKVQKMWVTSRPYNIQSELEDKLNSFSYTLTGLTNEEQRMFLKKFWESRLKIEIEYKKFGTFVDKLRDIFVSLSETDDRPVFMGIPLHVRMIASVYQNKFIKFYESKQKIIRSDFKNFSLYTLYNEFFKIKFDEIIISSTLNKANPNAITYSDIIREKTLEDHKLLAVFEIFPIDVLNYLLSENDIRKGKKVVAFLMEGKEKTGLVDRVINGKPHFVHRTFAEYFAADLLADMLNSRGDCESSKQCLYNIMTNAATQYFVLFNFLNYKLVSDCDDWELFTAAVNGNLPKKTETKHVGKIDSFGRSPLHLVLYSGRYSMSKAIPIIITKLKDCEIKVQDNLFGWTPLHCAIACHSKCGFSINKRHFIGFEYSNTQDINGKTPLILAVQRGCTVDCISFFIHVFDPDLNIQDKFGQTAIKYAMNRNDIDVFSQLLKYGADLEKEDNEGKTLLHTISEKGHVILFDKSLREIIKRRGEKCAKKMLENISFNDDISVRILSQYRHMLSKNTSIDINLVNSEGKSALHYAVINGNISNISYLLDKNADPNIEDMDGKTPLHYAHNDHNAVFKLLEAGAYFDVDGIEYTEILKRYLLLVNQVYCSVEDSVIDNNETFFLMPKEKNIIFNARTKVQGKTPLHCAAQSGNKIIVEWLLTNGACYNTTDANDNTPLDYACEYGHEDIAHLLLCTDKLFKAVESGIVAEVIHLADTECIETAIISRDYIRKGFQPIHLAIEKGNTEIFKVLLNKGGKVNGFVKGNTNGLHIAVLNYSQALFDFLLNHTERNDYLDLFTSRDWNNDTPLNIAIQKGNAEAIKTLLEKCIEDDTKPVSALDFSRLDDILNEAIKLATKLNKNEIGKLVERTLIKLKDLKKLNAGRIRGYVGINPNIFHKMSQ